MMEFDFPPYLCGLPTTDRDVVMELVVWARGVQLLACPDCRRQDAGAQRKTYLQG